MAVRREDRPERVLPGRKVAGGEMAVRARGPRAVRLARTVPRVIGSTRIGAEDGQSRGGAPGRGEEVRSISRRFRGARSRGPCTRLPVVRWNALAAQQLAQSRWPTRSTRRLGVWTALLTSRAVTRGRNRGRAVAVRYLRRRARP